MNPNVFTQEEFQPSTSFGKTAKDIEPAKTLKDSFKQNDTSNEFQITLLSIKEDMCGQGSPAKKIKSSLNFTDSVTVGTSSNYHEDEQNSCTSADDVFKLSPPSQEAPNSNGNINCLFSSTSDFLQIF